MSTPTLSEYGVWSMASGRAHALYCNILDTTYYTASMEKVFNSSSFLCIHYENMAMQYTEIFSALKIEKFHQKNLDIFHMFAQNIDCGYTLEPVLTNEYPQSMFWSKNKKKRYTPEYRRFTI